MITLQTLKANMTHIEEHLSWKFLNSWRVTWFMLRKFINSHFDPTDLCKRSASWRVVTFIFISNYLLWLFMILIAWNSHSFLLQQYKYFYFEIIQPRMMAAWSNDYVVNLQSHMMHDFDAVCVQQPRKKTDLGDLSIDCVVHDGRFFPIFTRLTPSKD